RLGYQLALPKTGFVVESRRFDSAATASPFAFEVPAGNYVLTGGPSFQPCGTGPPLPDPLTGLCRTVEARGGRPCSFRHRMEEGVSISLEVTVEGASEGAQRIMSAENTRRVLTAWHDSEHDPDDRWFATATLERVLRAGEEVSGLIAAEEPAQVRLAWWRQHSAVSRSRLPLGSHGAYTTGVYPPGDYLLRLEGPSIESRSIEITITPEELTSQGCFARGRRTVTVSARR
ncbi:MAG: hypothetical protein AAGG01_05280, partial [Planctomycetota bacterium]